MEQRYSHLYSQDGLLYDRAAPVLVTGGAVLADSLTRKVLVQLKFKNISDKEISSLSALILPLNADGEEVGRPVEYKYGGLSVHRDESFGTGAAVVMPNTAVRSYKLRVEQVCFADGSQWLGERFFAPLSAPGRLETALDDEELSRQFKISYGEDCCYFPEEKEDLWFCACGAVNHEDESKCHKCRRVHSALKNISIPSLRSEASKRVVTEKKYEEEEDIENSEKRARLKKRLVILIPTILVLAVLLATLPGYFIRKSNYEKADALLEQGQFDQAQKLFTLLGDYEDSRELAEQEIPYRRAAYIMDCAEKGDTDGFVMLGLKRSELGEDETVSTRLYQEAAKLFAALGEYKDSAERSAAAEKAVADYYEGLLSDGYDAACQLLGENSFCQARDAFDALGDYKDSREMADECIYQKAEMLLELVDRYAMEGISCSLSSTTGEKSVFYIPQEIYIKLGSGISTDIREICGADGVEINYEAPFDDADCLPFCDAVSTLYAELGDYKDSAEKSGAATEAGDYTKAFYSLVRHGRLPEAIAWLSEFDGDFAERDQWTNFIGAYLPFCGTWQFDTGDPTLIPRTLGVNAPCNMITTAVCLSEDGGAILRICLEGNADYTIELLSNINADGTISFFFSPDGVTTFYLVINNAGQINYSKYNTQSPSSETQCAVYGRIA